MLDDFLDYWSPPRQDLHRRLQLLQLGGTLASVPNTGDLLKDHYEWTAGPNYAAQRKVLLTLEQHARKTVLEIVRQFLDAEPPSEDGLLEGGVLRMNRGESWQEEYLIARLQVTLRRTSAKLRSKMRVWESERPEITARREELMSELARAAESMTDEQLLAERDRLFWGIYPEAENKAEEAPAAC